MIGPEGWILGSPTNVLVQNALLEWSPLVYFALFKKMFPFSESLTMLWTPLHFQVLAQVCSRDQRQPCLGTF